MKKFLRVLKWLGLAVLLIILGIIVAVFTLKDRKFDAPYPNITASKDTALIARGKYLVNGPTHCAHCHSPLSDLSKLDEGQIVPLVGGHDFPLGPLGTIYSPNLTSDAETGIGNYKDEEIARLLRHGVKRDGTTMINMMPYYDMSDYDVKAIISYLRTLAPVKNPNKPNDWTFMGNTIRAFALKPIGPSKPNPSIVIPDSTADYGKYMAYTVANCYGCHTDRNDMGEYIGQPFAGGAKFPSEVDPSKLLITPNITADQETGRLAYWSEDQFIKRFRQGKLIKESIMPWGPYSRMSDLELKALYRYLKSIPGVKRDNGPIMVNMKDV